MSRLCVFLAGPSGAGKSDVAWHLCKRHGFSCVSLGDICRVEAQRRGWPTDRMHLQRAGDALRGGEPARLAMMALEQAQGSAVVIDGVRLVAEGEYLRARGVIGVRVEAPEALRMERLVKRDGDSRMPSHRTEAEAGRVPADIVLVNTRDALAFARDLRDVVARIAAVHIQRDAQQRAVSE